MPGPGWPGNSNGSGDRAISALHSLHLPRPVLCMLFRHHAIGLQTDCMVAVLAPMVEAARFPHLYPMALGYVLPLL